MPHPARRRKPLLDKSAAAPLLQAALLAGLVDREDAGLHEGDLAAGALAFGFGERLDLGEVEVDGEAARKSSAL